MLFIQRLSIEYDKRSRSGEAMRRISAVRFERVPDEVPDLSGGGFFLHDVRQRSAEVFPPADRMQITERAYAVMSGEVCRIFYSSRPADQHFKPVMALDREEYGRIVYNERAVTPDGEWYYIRTTINILNADASKLRTKMFFRKEADHLFEDLAYLRYCGADRKA